VPSPRIPAHGDWRRGPGGENLFFHTKGKGNQNVKALTLGQAVTYTVGVGRNGDPVAENVALSSGGGGGVGGAPVGECGGPARAESDLALTRHAQKIVLVEELVAWDDVNGLQLDERAGVEGNTALIRAAGDGNLDHLRVLLDAGCNINVADARNHFTALHMAVCRSNPLCAALLIHRRADLECRTHNDETPLITACRHGDAECVRVLLTAGANVMAVMKANGASGLCLAAQNGHADVVGLLCERGGEDLLEQADLKNCTALVSAVRYAHTDIVRMMLQHRLHTHTLSHTCISKPAEYMALDAHVCAYDVADWWTPRGFF
jgi:cold shock CspA family protein